MDESGDVKEKYLVSNNRCSGIERIEADRNIIRLSKNFPGVSGIKNGLEKYLVLEVF